MCLGGGGSRAPIYTYNYAPPTPAPTIPTPEAPPPIPETENISAKPVEPKKLEDLKTTQATGHKGGTGSVTTGSGTTGKINV